MANSESRMVLVQVGAGPRPATVVLWRRNLAGGPSPAAKGQAARALRPVGRQRVGARRAVPLQSADASASRRLWTPTALGEERAAS
jgi:hypothetical protein